MRPLRASIAWQQGGETVSLLVSIFRKPAKVCELDSVAWDLLIRQARHGNLLGRLYVLLDKTGHLANVPAQPRNHMLSGATMAERQHLSIKHEIGLLHQTFCDHGLPLILLKGAAYVAAGLPAANGRVFADIDILVPQIRLAEAESVLMQTGWLSTATDAYDQRYYRQWMHELPAMQHMFRGASLDVHHTILPPTSRIKPDARLLVESSIKVPGLAGVRILSPCDMVLHSATHLFHEGEPDNLLRDLTDLDLLLREFSRLDGSFWGQLIARAELLSLEMPLILALRYTNSILDTPVPDAVIDFTKRRGKAWPKQAILDAIYGRVLRPQHDSVSDWFSPIARRLLYIRAHWLRMPPLLLAYHLGHKFLFPPKAVSVPLDGERQR